MTHYFLDSSSLVKRYITETGSDWIRAVVAPSAGNTIVIAQVTPVEVMSAIYRQRREGIIAPRTAQAVRRLVDRHTKREYLVIELISSILQRAQDLLEVHPLRAYDSIQLASALKTNKRLIAAGESALVFVSADARLVSAATVEGLANNDV